jgi:predicted RNA-binding protein YlqC (UPF0109 family)
MSEIDQQFIEYVVRSLVGKPDAVHIDRRVDEKGVLLELTVDPEDLGRVIGKRGATAQSLRTLLRALGTKNDARYNLKIIDNGPDDRPRPARSDDRPADDSSAPAPAAAPKQDDVADAVTEDTAITEEAKEPQPAASPSSEPEEVQEEPRQQTSDRLAQTRAELADLDDLDV